MSKKKKPREKDEIIGKDLRLNPQDRLANKFDETSVAEFTVAKRDKMGVRVVDNCAEEHMM